MIGYIIGAIILAFVLIIVIRTLRFKPKDVKREPKEHIDVPADLVAENLAEMIKCRTVSHSDPTLDDEEEFEKFVRLLPRLFPNVHKTCSPSRVGNRALLYRWQGKTDGDPTVFMAHYDVVSVEEDKWDKPPFDGIIEDGVLWGRGVIDTKGSLNAVLNAAELLIKDGFVPERDIWFAFAGDEEVSGHGARDIVELFKEHGITPSLVLDEGGAVVNNVFPGVKKSCAVIGIAEKGMLNAEYSISGGGGHSSAPKPHTPVGKLSAACVRVENHPFKYRLTPPTQKMLDTIAPHSTFLYRMIFANLWCFGPVLNLIGKKSGGQLNAIVRTTLAFTQMEGSKGINVIPPYARMCSNSRILPGETVDSTLEHIKKTVKDDSVTVRKIDGHNPSSISSTDCEGWYRLTESVATTWPEAIVSPYLMTACSDARHWGVISDKVYRFSPMRLSPGENASVHGNNEKLAVDKIAESVEFYIRLIKKS